VKDFGDGSSGGGVFGREFVPTAAGKPLPYGHGSDFGYSEWFGYSERFGGGRRHGSAEGASIGGSGVPRSLPKYWRNLVAGFQRPLHCECYYIAFVQTL
jgi:hypothetical protein